MTSSIRVGVIGAEGRMGAATCRAVDADDELKLVAKVCRSDSLEALVENGAEVAVDFTTPDAVRANVEFVLDKGIHAVVGATGLSSQDLEELGQRAQGGPAKLFVAPNFALGAVLMMRFASEAAPFFDTAEIVERHHEKKLDAPSGTSLRTAELMNEARAEPWRVTQTEKETLPGSRGGDVSGIRVHSIRSAGSIAHQEVVLGSPGETLTIRHDSLDRSSFMPGVVLAIKKVAMLDGPTVGLEHLLDL
ncbi:MAG: 4-hydroxy-tetrahydrodipicolinate reductase [Actinomycetota bacterium]|nr:4-hydroxy-tetrahydrodipicolinate reductase [Actinomycetota bacterium]